MNAWVRLFALALCTTVLTLTVRKQTPELGLLLSLSGCVAAVLLIAPWLTDLLDLLGELGEKAGLESDVLEPMWKVIGIGLLTQISSSVCTDAGQTALSKLMELGGGLLALCAAGPLLRAMLALIEELL